jgi:hypothetical protein
MKLRLALCASLYAGALIAAGFGSAASAADTLTNATLNGQEVPVFELDRTWPKLPNNWVLGVTSKVAIDSHGNAWIFHRPHTATGGTAAPPIVVLDKDGKFVRAWGGPAAGYDWPDSEHNIVVDAKDVVTISGSSPSGQSLTKRSDDMILKFTADGKFIKQYSGRDRSKGSLDMTSVNKPGDFFLWRGDLYVADGYGNRRVLVMDPDTFAIKRMWGPFGKPPHDVPGKDGGPGANGGPREEVYTAAAQTAQAGRAAAAAPRPAPVLDTEGPGPDNFASPVHGIVVSDDGLVYVADRSNRRMQVFDTQGKYITQMFLNRAGPAAGSVTGMALSKDPAQRFIYLSDYGNSHIAVVDRKTLKVLYQFGQRGKEPGNFQGIHLIDVDAAGNIYAAEVAPGMRAQRFLYKGLSKTLPANALTPEQLDPKPAPARGD